MEVNVIVAAVLLMVITPSVANLIVTEHLQEAPSKDASEITLEKVEEPLNSDINEDIEANIDKRGFLSTPSATVCERQRQIISCRKNEVIEILDASFGRRSRLYCRDNAMRNTNCRSASSQEKVSQLCNSKRSCVLYASRSVFGSDPCPGTSKYLRVEYKCVFPEDVRNHATVCEHQRQTISCRPNEVIQVVAATFGRLSLSYCPSAAMYNTNCRSASSLDRVSPSCNSKRSCVLYASRSVFGSDPCPGTSKYLSVDYRCITPAANGGWSSWGPYGACTTTRPPCGQGSHSRYRVCDNPVPGSGGAMCSGAAVASNRCTIPGCAPPPQIRLSYANICKNQRQTISCKENELIRVATAIYGRLSRSYCRGPATENTNCRDESAKVKAIASCNKKRSCSLYASTSVFGDPCPGTNKYLRLTYKCIPKEYYDAPEITLEKSVEQTSNDMEDMEDDVGDAIENDFVYDVEYDIEDDIEDPYAETTKEGYDARYQDQYEELLE